jgi:hypothetical protein
MSLSPSPTPQSELTLPASRKETRMTFLSMHRILDVLGSFALVVLAVGLAASTAVLGA